MILRNKRKEKPLNKRKYKKDVRMKVVLVKVFYVIKLCPKMTRGFQNGKYKCKAKKPRQVTKV